MFYIYFYKSKLRCNSVLRIYVALISVIILVDEVLAANLTLLYELNVRPMVNLVVRSVFNISKFVNVSNI